MAGPTELPDGPMPAEASLGGAAVASESEPASMIERVRRATFRVITECGTGSGALIDENIVATNAHVVTNFAEWLGSEGTTPLQSLPRVTASDSDGNFYPSRVLWWALSAVETKDSETYLTPDIAFVELDRVPPTPPLLRGRQNLKRGEQVWAFGHPGSVGGCEVTSGLLRDLPAPGKSALRHSASISPGSSGGPLALADGGLLGINVRTNPDERHLNQNENSAVTADVLFAEYSKLVERRRAHPNGRCCQFCGEYVPSDRQCCSPNG